MKAQISKYLVSLVTLSIMVLAFAHSNVSADTPTEHVVEITGFQFVPDSIDVKKGDTITWVNLDIAPHTATADDATFDTGDMKMGASVSMEVSSSGVISYFCRYHPMMKAEVNVR